MSEKRQENLITKIGVFYDGNYFLNASNYYYYVHKRQQRLSISGLHLFIKKQVAKELAVKERFCQIIDSHFFKGRMTAKDLASREHKLYSERVFDDILMYEGVISHYLPLKYLGEKAYEKGIDVWLALEALELSLYKKFDVVVLVVCDGDYLPLLRKLISFGVKVMIINWEYEFYSDSGQKLTQKTAQSILDVATFPVMLSDMINDNNNANIDLLFVDKHENIETTENQSSTQQGINELSPVSGDIEYSEIFSLKTGYGFIKYANNNLFFHYSNLVNCDFQDLSVGDRVSFIRGKSNEGSEVAYEINTLEKMNTE
jgi:uncharacterized LabA/DUF88 family protein/cold shock CspA family protein